MEGVVHLANGKLVLPVKWGLESGMEHSNIGRGDTIPAVCLLESSVLVVCSLLSISFAEMERC